MRNGPFSITSRTVCGIFIGVSPSALPDGTLSPLQCPARPAQQPMLRFTPAASTRWCRSAVFASAPQLPRRSRWSLRERWPKFQFYPFRPAARNSGRCGPRSPAPRSCAAFGRCRNWLDSTRPSLRVTSLWRAAVMPKMIAPSICARTALRDHVTRRRKNEGPIEVNTPAALGTNRIRCRRRRLGARIAGIADRQRRLATGDTRVRTGSGRDTPSRTRPKG
jgi:hypothetical protein